MSSQNNIYSTSKDQLIKVTSQGVQTDESSIVNDESDESLIDLTSLNDSDSEYADVALERIPTFENINKWKSGIDSLVQIENANICQIFCETYKNFFKDVYNQTDLKNQNENDEAIIKSELDTPEKEKIIGKSNLFVQHNIIGS